MKYSGKIAGAVRDLLIWGEQRGLEEIVCEKIMNSFSLSPSLKRGTSEKVQRTIVNILVGLKYD
jgi:hypothetical protein